MDIKRKITAYLPVSRSVGRFLSVEDIFQYNLTGFKELVRFLEKHALLAVICGCRRGNCIWHLADKQRLVMERTWLPHSTLPAV